MATTTYGSPNPSTRTNPAIYWAVGAAIVIGLIAFFSLRSADDRVAPAAATQGSATESTTTTTTDSTTTGAEGAPAAMGTVNEQNVDTAPAQNSTIPMEGTDAKSGSSMNTDTQSNPNNSNTGGQPTTEPARQ